MNKRQQARNHQVYRNFFSRYEHSGLTVGEFCRKEHFSTKTFVSLR